MCAEFLVKKKVPAPFRIHAGPPVEKLTHCASFLFELGVQLGGGDEPKAQDYAKLLASLGDRPDVRLIHTVAAQSEPGDLQPGQYRPFRHRLRELPRISPHRSGATPTCSCTAPSRHFSSASPSRTPLKRCRP